MKKFLLGLMLLLAAGSSVERLGAGEGDICESVFGHWPCDAGFVCVNIGLMSNCQCPDGQHYNVEGGGVPRCVA